MQHKIWDLFFIFIHYDTSQAVQMSSEFFVYTLQSTAMAVQA